jgi:hypothetical protein
MRRNGSISWLGWYFQVSRSSGINGVVVVTWELCSRHGLDVLMGDNGKCPTSSGSDLIDFLVDIPFQVGWKD